MEVAAAHRAELLTESSNTKRGHGWKLQLLINEQYNERTANREQCNSNKLTWKPQLRL
jgi:hypothetical protein